MLCIFNLCYSRQMKLAKLATFSFYLGQTMVQFQIYYYWLIDKVWIYIYIYVLNPIFEILLQAFPPVQLLRLNSFRQWGLLNTLNYIQMHLNICLHYLFCWLIPGMNNHLELCSSVINGMDIHMDLQL